MNKSLKYSFAAISAVSIVSLGAVLSKPGQAQIAQGLVVLQANTPGFTQTGNTNIGGTARAGEFVGGGSGVTGVDAAKLGGRLPANYVLRDVPIVLNGTNPGGVILRANNNQLTGDSWGLYGTSLSDTGRGVTGVGVSTTGVNFGVRGTTNSPNGWGGYFEGGKGLYAETLSVGNSTLVTNLNADLLDGQSGAFYTNAANLTGTISDALLSNNVARLNATQTFTAANSFTNPSNAFTGNGSGLTNVDATKLGGQSSAFYTNAANLTGTIADARLSSNVALLNAAQTFTAAKTFNANIDVNARTTTDNFTMETGGAANTVLLGTTGGVASWGTVGSSRLQSDAASLGKVTGGAWTMDGTTLKNGTGGLIELFDGATKKMEINANPGAAGRVLTYGPNGENNVSLTALGTNTNHGMVNVFDANGTIQAQMYVNATGQGIIVADTKNFVVPDPTDARYNIVYACVEGPEAAMYTRGTGRLVNGQAVIELPDHYLKLANLATATIQVTPLDDCRGLFVKKTNGMIIVKELGGGKANVEFDWRIEAVRKGHEDYRPVRPWNDALPEGDEQEMWNARLQSIAAKQARARNRSNRP